MAEFMAEPLPDPPTTPGPESTELGPESVTEAGDPARKRRRRGSRGGRSRSRRPADDLEGDDDVSSDDAAPGTDTPPKPEGKPQIGDTRPARPGPGPRPRDQTDEVSPDGPARRRRRGGRGRGERPEATDAGPRVPRPPRADRRPVEMLTDAPLAEQDAETLERRRGRERNGRPVGRYLMVVHKMAQATQIAILEGRVLIEHYVSHPQDDTNQIDGNIYVGRVQNVLPGMEAAFIDIGTPKNAVLYRGDVRYDTEDVESGASSSQPRIEQVLRPGQSILCQVTKNPIGAKGARLTQEVSIPGRFVVLVPNSTAYGISKRLDDSERKRLRKIVDAVRPKGHGLIVRTAAAGASAEELSNDVERLVAEWEGIAADALKGTGAALLYQEPVTAVRVIREELNREYRAVVIDDLALFEQVRDYVGAVNPELADRVEYFDPVEEALPVFERFHVYEQLHKALGPKAV